MDITQPFSAGTFVITQWAHKQNGHGGMDRDNAWAWQHGFLISKTDLVIATAEYPICQQQGLTPSPQYGTVP